MNVLFVVRNQLQAELYREIIASPGFMAHGATARWLWLIDESSVAVNGHKGSSMAHQNTHVPLVGQLESLSDWRHRLSVLGGLRTRIARECRLHRPAAIVLANDRPFAEQTVIRMARHYGIPTVLIQDGWIPSWQDLNWPDRFRRSAAHLLRLVGVPGVGAGRPGLGSTDYCGVMGRWWLTRVRSRSGSPGTVRVVGQPLFDATMRSSRQRHAASGEPTRPYRILFLATDFAVGIGDDAAHRAQMRDIGTLHSVLHEELGDEFVLTIRPHPMEGQGYFSALQKGFAHLTIDANSSLDAAISGQDLVVSNLSSTCLAVIETGVPSLVFSHHLSRGRYGRLLQLQPGRRAVDREAVRECIRDLGDADKRREWIDGNRARARDYLYVDPERTAADLVVEFLTSIIARSSSPTLITI